MSLKIPTATLLLLLLSVQVSENHRIPHRRVSPCCTSYSTSDIEVVGNTYQIQAAAPAYGCVHAVIFKTKEGSACANPKEPWVENLTDRMVKV
ncbi:uncharacterized protein V6R79_001264 [Siganus canaliculatus]